MPNLNQLELQHLRHLIGAHETAYQKLNTFSSQANVCKICTRCIKHKTKINVIS